MQTFFSRLMLPVGIILVVVVTITFLIRRAFRGHHNLRNQFMEAEQKANTARSRDVEQEHFYTPDISLLPKGAPEAVQSAAERTMVRFPQKRSNLELKSSYGIANLEKVTGFEENYTRYVSALVSWADDLLEDNETDAIKVFEHTVELSSEYRKTYMRLADHYNEAKKLDYLLDRVAEVFTDEGIRKQLTLYIMDKKESL